MYLIGENIGNKEIVLSVRAVVIKNVIFSKTLSADKGRHQNNKQMITKIMTKVC